jgi:hypothetical protein
MLSTPNDNNFKATSTFMTPPLRIKESMIIVVRLLIIPPYVTHSKEMKNWQSIPILHNKDMHRNPRLIIKIVVTSSQITTR